MPQIKFADVHPRIGLVELTVEPPESPVRPADTFRPPTYGMLVCWPRAAYDGWFLVEAEADNGTAVTRFSSAPMDLRKVMEDRRAGRLALAEQVLTDEWVYQNAFLVGAVTAPAAVRLTFRLDTNHEKFVRFVDGADGSGTPIGLTVVYFDGSVGQPEGQEVELLLHPATPVVQSPALLGLDLGNTCSTAALLDPFDRDSRGLATLTARIPMLTARPVNDYRLGAVGAATVGGAPLASELRFDLFRSYASPGDAVPINRRFPDLRGYGDDRPNAVEYVAGDLARAPGVAARSVVLGAKRMAAARPLRTEPDRGETEYPYATHGVAARHRVVYDPPPPDGAPPATEQPAVMEVDVRAPLELLACRVFQHFREAQRGWPGKVALTYPTTYSRHEFLALRRAVQRGWLRMQAAGQRGGGFRTREPALSEAVARLQEVVGGPLDLTTQAADPVVKLLVDEASAAAFFHLYRRIFERIDGGLTGFRHLYDRGLTMLLYDCGGGTTDIALVEARVGDDDRTLKVTVLRRSGVRTFGGDDITRQVCRLVKAKIANVLAAERRLPTADLAGVPGGRPPAAGDDKAWLARGEALEKYIADTAAHDPRDLLVPTRFHAGQTPVEARRAAALALWRLGEQMKFQLGSAEPQAGTPKDKFTPGEARLPVWTWSKALNVLTREVLAGTTDQQEAALKKKLADVSVSRAEIDALVYEPVMRSIANCNALIREVLEPPGGPTGEVQWVVASGNAVQYPFLQKALRDRLNVPYLDDPEQFTFDPADAKDATAKGAVLALAAMEAQAQQIDLRFDSRMYELLPFHVGYRTLKTNAMQVLYAEHTPYDALVRRGKTEKDTILIRQVSADEVAPRRFTLVRQFPGDDAPQDFLAFDFPDGIQGGHLKVWYDDQYPYEFRVEDGNGTPGTPVDLTAGDVYVAPAQRGDI